MKSIWINSIKFLALVIFCFLWFGVMIPFLINTPDDLIAGLGFVAYVVGGLIAITLVSLMWSKPLERLIRKIKEVSQ